MYRYKREINILPFVILLHLARVQYFLLLLGPSSLDFR